MRVALIRGSLLRPWELPNYVMPGVDVEAFASHGVARSMPEPVLPVHGLPSTGDVVSRFGPKAIAVTDLLAGSIERLKGLEDAVRGFDIAHALELANPLTAQAVAARDAGACRAVVATVMENIPYGRAQNRWVAARVKRMAAGVDHFLAITERARLHLNSAGVEDDRITTLPLGVDMDRFRPREGERAPGPVRIVTVARLEVGKGVEDLVIAVGLLARRGIEVHVSLVGQGPLAGRLLAIAADLGVADRVTIPGPTPWEELERVYRAHDVFVLASAPTRNWREQFGFAIVEAMGCGLPVVAGASGSLPEVVADADSLVTPHDPIGLADHLEWLATDAARMRAQGERNRRWAVERYGLPRIRDGLRDVYAAVLAR